MSARERIRGSLVDDAEEQELGYGKGGVPWFLLLFYLAFLVFFFWYALEYQLPDYLDQGPLSAGGSGATELGAPR